MRPAPPTPIMPAMNVPHPTPVDRRLSVAPMIDWTTREFRFLVRLITRRTLLYTEMITASAILRGNTEYLLSYDDAEHPLAIQLGGSDPGQLAEAAAIAEQFGYDEINLNVGCPSERVQSGAFGACLMAEPVLVAECVAAMAGRVDLPVTVKSRIGIDDQDDYAFLHRFIETVRGAGCRTFIIHARKAVLKGLSPKENREIPPLIYERAFQVKQDFPDCEVILNGGVRSLAEIKHHSAQVDGVMIGREAYQNPWFLVDADRQVFGDDHPLPSPADVIAAYGDYIRRRQAEGMHPRHALRHALGLFQGQPGARAYRRYLSEHMNQADATADILQAAVAHLQLDNAGPTAHGK